MCVSNKPCCVVWASKRGQSPPAPSGNIWICSGCYIKNNLLSPNRSRSRTNSGHNVNFADTAVIEQKPDEIVPEEEVISQVTSHNSPNIQASNSPICQLYLGNRCPHGTSGKKMIEGKECNSFLPTCCYRFIKEGPQSKYGCNKGKNCDSFHPILCKYSVRNRRCTNKECAYVHLRATKRWPENEDRPPRSDQPRHDDRLNEERTRYRSGPVSERNSARNSSTSGRNPRLDEGRTRYRSGQMSDRNPASNRSSSSRNPPNTEPRQRIRQEDERRNYPENNGNILRLIQDIRGDFQRELELMRAQMFCIKQPAPPPWLTSPHCFPPQMDQTNTYPNINTSQMDNHNMMHQIPQHQLPQYRDMLIRQQSSS